MSSLTDITGDGRPDLILQKNNRLWTALNRPAPDGKTVLVSAVPLQDLTFKNGAFSSHTASKRRFWYGSASRNTVDVWRQAIIDVNGDGRVDVIDAGEEANHWVVYLNTPGGTAAGIKWERRSLTVSNLRALLGSRLDNITGGFVPLSRRATGVSTKSTMCVMRNNGMWVPYSGSVNVDHENPDGSHTTSGVFCIDGQLTHAIPPSPMPCLADYRELCQRPRGEDPERTFTEWELSDLNGDGYPDFVFNSSPAKFILIPDGAVPANTNPQVLDMKNTFQLDPSNEIRVAYNVVGVHLAIPSPPFSRPISLRAEGREFGVEMWQSDPPVFRGSQEIDVQRQVAGLADVNGDGIVRLTAEDVNRLFMRHTSPMGTSVSLYHRHRFPAEIISHCVWLYFRFSLRFRDVEEMLAMRGVAVTYETVRE